MFVQRVVFEKPPLFAAIDAVFKVAGRPILFSWGRLIYNPMRVFVAPELMAHEAVHGERQVNVEAWWANYLISPQFRFDEELPAHRAEFKALCEIHRPQWRSQRGMRRVMAAHVARKLAAPLYGSLISIEKAKALILAD